MIIDAHAHLGYDYVFDEEASEEDLLLWYDRFHVHGAIVQPFLNRPYLEDTRQIHDRIHSLCKSYPGRFFGMSSINPHFKPDDYQTEAKRCITELGFVGLKLTPHGHAVHPSSQDGLHVFETAKGLDVPVMVHTGAGAPFADPISLINALNNFKDLPVILAHAGTDLYFQQALYLAKIYENVYLEPSWLSIINVRKALKEIGPSKILFSSDHAVNVPVELAKYRTLLEEGPSLALVLGGNARRIFGLGGDL